MPPDLSEEDVVIKDRKRIENTFSTSEIYVAICFGKRSTKDQHDMYIYILFMYTNNWLYHENHRTHKMSYIT